uniref:Immunoglobulin domain-containing protein n=1 Tax=Cyprinus carpio TaxID=7962 RepID=A0A8C1NRK6_CYPCA
MFQTNVRRVELAIESKTISCDLLFFSHKSWLFGVERTFVFILDSDALYNGHKIGTHFSVEKVLKMKIFVLFILCLLFIPGNDDDDDDKNDVSVMEGDSVTLHTGVKTNQQDRVTWYFNDTRIAQITGNHSKICRDDHCKERFKDRLKLDNQTGDLIITNIRTTDAGVYQLQTISRRMIQKIFSVAVHDVSGAKTDKMKTKSVKEGNSVTLDTHVIKNLNYVMKWQFNEILIAEITGDQSKICTDEQCKERFRDRLKLDNQTGSLTIMNIRTTDAGVYELQKNHRIHPHHSIISIRRFSITVTGASGVETDGVSVSLMEGDSVTLHSDVEINQQDPMKWYFNDIRIAQIIANQNRICTDVQCNEGTERFRDRLKLDHHTGDLTITNITTTDSGDYKLQTIRRKIIQKIFHVVVHDVPAAEREKIKRKSVKEGESVTLGPDVVKNPDDLKMWYFNDILITKITKDWSKICTDDQCKERFNDRLKLDHQTGSLTIMNTRTTDTGDYQLLINSSRFGIIKSFRVTVSGEYHFGHSVLFYLNSFTKLIHLNQLCKCFCCGLFEEVSFESILQYNSNQIYHLRMHFTSN